jgi:hypothetical protein
MNSTQNGVPSEKSKAILKALRETVAEELEKNVN